MAPFAELLRQLLSDGSVLLRQRPEIIDSDRPEAVAVLEDAIATGSRGVRHAAKPHLEPLRNRRRAAESDV